MARPKKKIDEALLKKLAFIHCSKEEMAHILETSYDTLHRRYATVIEAARSEGKMNLRRKRMQMALDGCVPLIIWMSKQVLGEYDKVEDPARALAIVEKHYADTKALQPGGDGKSISNTAVATSSKPKP